MPQTKLGRNAQCWCGSGAKYKFCHLDRDKDEPISIWDASRKFRKAFKVAQCLAPQNWQSNCSKKICHAHTVPKSISLRKIARDGHVYSYIFDFSQLNENNGVLQPILVGLNKASTFMDFCTHHDNEIFAPVEKDHFRFNQGQCFVLGYRALCKEIYNKDAASSLDDLYRSLDKGRPLNDQKMIHTNNMLFQNGLSAGVQDNKIHKSRYDSLLIKNYYNDIRSYVIEVDGPPDIMCSGAIFPEQDFSGEKLQDIGDLKITPDLLCVTSFFDGNKGLIVFTWLPDSDKSCLKFVSSLDKIPDKKVTAALIRFFFEHFENIHISPEWWESLSDKIRRKLNIRMSASANPFLKRAEKFLLDDGITFTPWVINGRHCLGFSFL